MAAVPPVAPLPPVPAPAAAGHNNISSSLDAASASTDASGGAAPLIVVIHAAQTATPQVVHIHLHPSSSPSPVPYAPSPTVANPVGVTATPRAQHVPFAPPGSSQHASGSKHGDTRHTPTVQFHNHAQRSSPVPAGLRISPTSTSQQSARASPPVPVPPSSHSPRPAWRRVPTGSSALNQLAHAQAQGRDMVDVLAELQQLEAVLNPPVSTGGSGNPLQIAPAATGGGWRRQTSRPNSFFGAMQLNQGPFGPTSSIGIPLITAGPAEEGPSEDMIFPLHPTEDPALRPSASASTGAGASPSVASVAVADNLDVPEPLSSRPESAYQTAAEDFPQAHHGTTMHSTIIVPIMNEHHTPDFPVNFPDGTDEGAGAMAGTHPLLEHAEEAHSEGQQFVDPSFLHMQMMEQHDEHQHTQAMIAHGHYSWETQMQEFGRSPVSVTAPVPLNAHRPGFELWSPPPGSQASPAPHASLYARTPPQIHPHPPPLPPAHLHTHSHSHPRAESPPPTRNTAASFGFDMGTPPARYASPPSAEMPVDPHSSLDMGPTPIDYANPVMHPQHGGDLDTSIASLMAGSTLSENGFQQSASYHQPPLPRNVQRSESPAPQQDTFSQLHQLSPQLASPRTGTDPRRLSNSVHSARTGSLSGIPGPFPSLAGLVSGHGLSASIPPPLGSRLASQGGISRHPSQAWLSSHALYQRAHPHPLHEQFSAEELGESQIYQHPHEEQSASYHSHSQHSRRSRTTPPPMSPVPASDARSSMMGSQYDSATLRHESTDEQETAHERDREPMMIQSPSSPDTLRLRPSQDVTHISPPASESRHTNSKRKTTVRIVDNHSQRHRERHGHGHGHGHARVVSRSPEYLWPTMARAASSGPASPTENAPYSPPLSPETPNSLPLSSQPQAQGQAHHHTYPPRQTAGSHSSSSSSSVSPGATTETGTGTNTTATTPSRVKTDLVHQPSSNSNSPTAYRPSPASPTMYRPPSVMLPTSPNLPLLTDFAVRSPTSSSPVTPLSSMRPHANPIPRPSGARQRNGMHSQSQRSSVASQRPNAGPSHRPSVPPPGAPRPGSGEWTWVMETGDR